MGGFKDQLLKAGLVSKKDVRRSTAEKRSELKTKGKQASDAAAEAEARRKALYEERLAQQKARDTEAEAARAAERGRKEADNRVRDLIRAHAVHVRGGERRFYFVCRDDVIRNLSVPDPIGQRLETGGLAIVEDPSRRAPSYRLVPGDVAASVAESYPDSIRFWNRPQRP